MGAEKRPHNSPPVTIIVHIIRTPSDLVFYPSQGIYVYYVYFVNTNVVMEAEGGEGGWPVDARAHARVREAIPVSTKYTKYT